MLAAFRGANEGALASGIGGILQHGGELFVLDARFFPFVRIVENLGALVLKFGGGVRKFVVKLLVEPGKRESGVLGFIGHGEAVVKRLVILGGIDELASGFVGARTNEKQWRLGRRSRDKQRGLRERPGDGRFRRQLGA